MDVGLYAVSIENSQPIEGGRDVKSNILALVQYLESFVRAAPDNIEFPFMSIFRYQHQPSLTHFRGSNVSVHLQDHMHLASTFLGKHCTNLWDFYSTKAQTLGPGQFRALARKHVFVLQYKCPVDGRPGDPNFRLLNHRSGILIQKRALESDIRRHYTGHDTFKFMAGVETLKEVHDLCRLQVDPSSTFVWGTDC